MNCIELPVSYGEALDKLTILEIKLEKINDDRRKDVNVEYTMLKSKLDHLFTQNVSYHYSILKLINISIWEMQDIFRDSSDTEEKIRLAAQIILDNDRRFRVKAKINTLMNSLLREQKGYARKKCIVRGNNNGVVRYLSTIFEKTVVISEEPGIADVYKDDITIECCSKIQTDNDSYSEFDCSNLQNVFEILHVHDDVLNSYKYTSN